MVSPRLPTMHRGCRGVPYPDLATLSRSPRFTLPRGAFFGGAFARLLFNTSTRSTTFVAAPPAAFFARRGASPRPRASSAARSFSS